MIYCPHYNITVGPEEESVENSDKYDVIISVADTAPRGPGAEKTKWYPIQEMSNWGYGPFYWFIKTIERLSVDQKVLVHCHAGVNRSPSMLVGYLKYKQPALLSGIGLYYVENFQRNMDKNHIPQDITKFFALMRVNPTYSLMGLMHLLEHHYAH